jgi:hypothetical protein
MNKNHVVDIVDSIQNDAVGSREQRRIKVHAFTVTTWRLTAGDMAYSIARGGGN